MSKANITDAQREAVVADLRMKSAHDLLDAMYFFEDYICSIPKDVIAENVSEETAMELIHIAVAHGATIDEVFWPRTFENNVEKMGVDAILDVCGRGFHEVAGRLHLLDMRAICDCVGEKYAERLLGADLLASMCMNANGFISEGAHNLVEWERRNHEWDNEAVGKLAETRKLFREDVKKKQKMRGKKEVKNE